MCAHPLRDGAIFRSFAAIERNDHARAIGRAAVLAHLELGIEPLDRHHERDDAAEQTFDVIVRCLERRIEARRQRCNRLPSRSEEHTSELQSLMRNSYAVFCLKKKKTNQHTT